MAVLFIQNLVMFCIPFCCVLLYHPEKSFWTLFWQAIWTIPWMAQNINFKCWDQELRHVPKRQYCGSNWFCCHFLVQMRSLLAAPSALLYDRKCFIVISVWSQYPCLPFPVGALSRLGVMFAQFPSCGRKPHKCDHFSFYSGGAIWKKERQEGKQDTIVSILNSIIRLCKH